MTARQRIREAGGYDDHLASACEALRIVRERLDAKHRALAPSVDTYDRGRRDGVDESLVLVDGLLAELPEDEL
jgi:hypothetical protein